MSHAALRPSWLDAHTVKLVGGPTLDDLVAQEAAVRALRSLAARMRLILDAPASPAAVGGGRGDVDRLVPRGALLYGRPGTGKSMSVAALASVLPPDTEIYQVAGMTARRWTDISAWSVARAAAQAAGERVPWCVLVVDELERVSKRTGPIAPDKDPVLLQWLVMLSGVETKSEGHDRILTIATTTSLPAGIDSGLMRRLALRIQYDAPEDPADRETLLRRHIADFAAPNLDLARCSRLISGRSSQATIVLMALEAVGIAIDTDQDAPVVTTAILEESIRGHGIIRAPRRERDRRVESIHEAGHACLARALNLPVKVAALCGDMDSDGGRTELVIPNLSRVLAESMVIVAYGGQLAEALLLGSPTLSSTGDVGVVSRLISKISDNALLPGYPPLNVRIENDVLYQQAAGTFAIACRDRAREMLAEPGRRAVLERVARAIEERGSLVAEELDAIIAGDDTDVGDGEEDAAEGHEELAETEDAA